MLYYWLVIICMILCGCQTLATNEKVITSYETRYTSTDASQAPADLQAMFDQLGFAGVNNLETANSEGVLAITGNFAGKEYTYSLKMPQTDDKAMRINPDVPDSLNIKTHRRST